MKLRFPLLAKILLWFFLNLVVLAVVFLLFLRGQFQSGFDWLLATGAGHRIQAASDLIVAELNERQRLEYGDILKRFNQAYRVQFYIFNDVDAAELAGEPIELPKAVRARILSQRRTPAQSRPREGFPGGGPPEGRPDQPSLAAPPSLGENPKHMLRTSSPTRYWVLVRVGLRAPGIRYPVPATLVVMSNTIVGGGLFLDYKPWLAGAGLAVALSVLLWLPLVHSLTRSLGKMTLATQRIAEGGFDQHVEEHRRDELGALGQSINRMAERLAGFVTGQKRFLGDVAHELCAPIARMQMALGILEQRTDEKTKANVEDLREEVQHMSGLVNGLLSFSKASLGASTLKLQPVLLRAVAEEAFKRERTAGVQIRLDVSDQLYVLGEPELLARALSNLLRNAIRYAAQGGPIIISARSEDAEMLVTVSDCGPGVPEPELARIFDPFYRLDVSREATTGGVGLGLAIVKTCVESCHGTVSCCNRQPSGLEVTIKLMAASKALPGSTLGGMT
jgi:two-component system, OmpR family, sensor histidine kinase CpxA